MLEICPLKAQRRFKQIDARWKEWPLTAGVNYPQSFSRMLTPPSAEKRGGRGSEVEEGRRRGNVTGLCVICGLTGEEYSSEQVGVSESLTAPFKMTKSILWY